MSELELFDAEDWRRVPGYGGAYEVSDRGNVRSLDREIVTREGKRSRRSGGPMLVRPGRDGRSYVYLSRDGQVSKRWVVELMEEAFAVPARATVALRDDPPVTVAPTVVTSEVVRVPFHGDDLLCVEVGGRPHVILRPAIEALGLDYSTQVRKLRGKSWARVGMMPTRDSAGRTQEAITVDVRTFLMLLATIDEDRVAGSVRPKLVAYQAEVADAIESYFTRGGAINPRASEDQLVSLANITERRLVMLRAATGLVDASWLEAKTRHEIARGLGEEPEVDPAQRPLTVGEFLQDKGVNGEALRKLSPKFGKRVKELYRIEHDGTEPAPTERFVDGALRQVAGYTEQHRHLFESVWTALGGTS